MSLGKVLASKTLRIGSSEDSDFSFVKIDTVSSNDECVIKDLDIQLHRKPMRVILVQTADGLKPPSGGFRGNYALLHALTVHGHQSAQLCWAYPKDIIDVISEFAESGKRLDMTTNMIKLRGRDNKDMMVQQWVFTNIHGVLCIALDCSVMIKKLPNEVQVHDAAIYIRTGEPPERIIPYVDYMKKNIEMFKPTHVVFNDALSSQLTSTMTGILKNTKRVQITHTFEQLPLGPFAGGVPGSATAAEDELVLWKGLDGILTVSKSLQKYASTYNGLDTVMIPNHPWVYKNKENYQWPRRRFNFSKRRVVMVNPAHVKGFTVFHDVAKHFKLRKDVEFIAYKGWGSKDHMVEALEEAGVRVLDKVSDMEPVYDDITVLMVPSHWEEAWGLVVTEAQLRGIVVASSDRGGLPEAKRYVHPILPTNMIDGTKRDQNGSYIIPPQDITPWIKEIEKLLSDQDYYHETANAAYLTTRNWVKNFDPRAHEKFLLGLQKD